MDTQPYHKINAIFKRHMSGPDKGKLIVGDWAVPEIEYLANNEWEFTEKVDGTNIRVWYGYEPGCRTKVVKFFGRTDNASIPSPLLEMLTKTFTVQLFEQAFPNADSNPVVLYGEGYGPKIQSGGLYRKDQSFVLFDVKVGPWWLLRDAVNDVALKMGIDSVPVIGYGTIKDAIQMVTYGTITRQGQIFPVNRGEKFEGLCSQWGPFEAEGIVARPRVPMFSRSGERIIAKIKARDFK